MSFTTEQIVSLLVALIAGGVITKLISLPFDKRKSTDDSQLSQASAAKTYHEMSMEIFREVRIEADKLQLRVQLLTTEVESLHRQVHLMTLQLEEKDKIIESLRRSSELDLGNLTRGTLNEDLR